MNKVFGYIFTGFGCLLVLILLILFFSEGSIIDSHSNFSDRRQIILSIMFTIFPIVGGLFLIYGENKKGNLFGVILIYIGIFLLLVFIDPILDLSSDPDPLNDLFPILFGIIPIVGGLFLIFRKKEQINSDSQNITDEDQNGITNSQINDESIESKLEKLKSMLDKELITEEEFNAKKQNLIDEM